MKKGRITLFIVILLLQNNNIYVVVFDTNIILLLLIVLLLLQTRNLERFILIVTHFNLGASAVQKKTMKNAIQWYSYGNYGFSIKGPPPQCRLNERAT